MHAKMRHELLRLAREVPDDDLLALETHYQRGVCLKIKPASLLPLLPRPDWPGCHRSLRAGYI